MTRKIFAATVGFAAITMFAGSTAMAGDAGGGKEEESDLTAVDVAAFQTGEYGARIFVRGFEDGTVEQNIYTPSGGFTGWSEIPDPFEADPLGNSDLEAVQVLLFDQPLGARLFMRAFEDGRIQQNIYTTAGGYSGWVTLPHEDVPELLGEDLESADCIALNGLFGPRLFVRSFEDGLIEQCIYTPGDAYLGWTEVPAITGPFGGGTAGSSDVEGVAVTAYGGLYDHRIFVVGQENGRVYQNGYTPALGYLGWTRVRNFNDSILGGSDLVAVDILRIDEPAGSLIYLRANENGRVQQNIYTPQTGFSGWSRIPNTVLPGGNPDLEDAAVTAFDGLFGPRVFVRGFENGRVQQNIYTPGEGYSGWSRVPDKFND